MAVLLAAYLLRGFSNTPLSNVSAVETGRYTEVYWDQNCSRPVYSIDWGSCAPGQAKDISVYVRNVGSEEFVLAITPVGWSPVSASRYLRLSRVGEGTKIQPGQVARITVRLSVSSIIQGISYFSFQTIFEGREHRPGDLNLDGEVDTHDVIIACAAYESVPGGPNWNPKADLTRDGIVNIFDLILLLNDYAQTS